ncbi:restriction endonuclease subunit M [Pasteurellaceae bacterium TAE3-ERU1]|nr:restriction endonuclease subunit M [Pasteurellaceae bacterium TAE3-ERU1]
MSKLTELTQKLKEIFQIDRADLDFGIYRILNSRSQEIDRYLTYTLPEKVKAAFSTANQDEVKALAQELDKLKTTLSEAGVSPEASPKYQALNEQIQAAQKGSANSEAAIFSHLLTFFSRYYEDGDFISQRRYKGNTYAIPYNGEEVMLHWANKDQYYTKSGENFSNYRFTLDDGRDVFFRLIAADTAKDNRKDNDGKRVFMLATARTIEKEDEAGDIYEEEILPFVINNDGQQLQIHFEYQLTDKKDKQENHNQAALEILKSDLPAEWQAVWQKMPTEKNPHRTLLEKHLSDYTQKNTADYFIHKDLGGFLRRELDFYIKNEVMHLDNIQEADSFAHIEHHLRQIQILRSIAHELIDFLSKKQIFVLVGVNLNSLFITKIASLGHPNVANLQKMLGGKIVKDSVFVTNSLRSYQNPPFDMGFNQIRPPKKKFKSGAFI